MNTINTVFLGMALLTAEAFAGDVARESGFAMDGYFVWCGSCIKVGDTYHLFSSRWPVETKFPEGYKRDLQNPSWFPLEARNHEGFCK
jgi:hypothetical protein